MSTRISMKKFLNRLKTSKPAKYFRELSIVIIGVLITLTITNITASKAKQREIRELMALIKIELNDNLMDVEKIEKQWDREQEILSVLKQNINQLENIPADTLLKYRDINNPMGILFFLMNTSDSYEVFKSSLLLQYVKDKDFLRKLAQTYRTLDMLSQQLTDYSDRKTKGMYEMIENLNQKGIEQWAQGTVYQHFQIPLSFNLFRIFVYNGGSILDPQLFNKTKNMLRYMISEIDKQF